MREKQNVKKRAPVVIEQHLKHAWMGVGPVVGVESAKIKDNGALFELTFDKEQISAARILRKGILQGEVKFTETADGRLCEIVNQGRCALVGLKNNEVVQAPFVLGSADSNGDIDSAIHVGSNGNFSIMSGLEWAYLYISSIGLRKTTFQNAYPHVRSMEPSAVARVVIKTDDEIDNQPQTAVTNPQYGKGSLNSQKQAIFSALGHLSREKQHEMLSRFLSIVTQAKKRGKRHG